MGKDISEAHMDIQSAETVYEQHLQSRPTLPPLIEAIWGPPSVLWAEESDPRTAAELGVFAEDSRRAADECEWADDSAEQREAWFEMRGGR